MPSKIEWTNETWNPITGCSKISIGCQNCYAEKMANRLRHIFPKYRNGFELTLHHDELDRPLRWKKPRMIFVCSMSDIFHRKVPDDFILKIFETMNKAHWHIFQVLTKRPERLESLKDKINWTPNIWLGTTVEIQANTFRIPYIINTQAKIKFLSLEPLLGPIDDLPLANIDWVIVGGESGSNARSMKKEWVINIKNQCKKAGIPFFFKQWGGKNKKVNGNLLEGKKYQEYPINFFLAHKASRKIKKETL
ncbi:DUF5131 family protein [Persephonella sp.]